MVAPFGGCAFGALLYDFFVYTGPESPINRPWLGIEDAWEGIKGSKTQKKAKDEGWEV